MDLNEYQKKAFSTCTESSNNFAYMFLNLISEVGEIAKNLLQNGSDFDSKIEGIINTQIYISQKSGEMAKKIRKSEVDVKEMISKSEDEFYKNLDPFVKSNHIRTDQNTKFEIGDVLWQLAGLCSVFNFDINEIAELNLKKLERRQAENKIIEHE
jgi:NTP pyrophosphatase (non-canonical NTP hydrolase)